MANLKVNTEAVVGVAEMIKRCNTQIRDDFSAVQEAIVRLDGGWDSPAAAAALSKFNEIKSQMPEARYNVLDNYANFLLQQVGEGYVQTEEVNISLADQFK